MSLIDLYRICSKAYCKIEVFLCICISEPFDKMLNTLDAVSGMEECALEKKRRSVEYNAYELVCALCLCDSSILTKEHIENLVFEMVSDRLFGCSIETFQEYKNDLAIRPSKVVDSYISRFRENLSPAIVDVSEITRVFLEGKKLRTPELIELNVGVNHKRAKADVYFQKADGTFIGLSVKQSDQCTKTNFSVEKILSEIAQSPEYGKTLSGARKQFLANAGFAKHDRTKRDEVNALFYPGKANVYWDLLRTEIKKYNDEIKKTIVSDMFPVDLPYTLYEFNGNSFQNLRVDIESVVFNEHAAYYYDKKGGLRHAAKLYYQLSVNGHEYRIEVRWKGNIHTASPQFQTHTASDV